MPAVKDIEDVKTAEGALIAAQDAFFVEAEAGRESSGSDAALYAAEALLSKLQQNAKFHESIAQNPASYQMIVQDQILWNLDQVLGSATGQDGSKTSHKILLDRFRKAVNGVNAAGAKEELTALPKELHPI